MSNLLRAAGLIVLSPVARVVVAVGLFGLGMYALYESTEQIVKGGE